MTVGQNIRRCRRERGMTQWELSQLIGIRPATILLIERGQLECPYLLMQKIAKALDVKEDDLKV